MEFSENKIIHNTYPLKDEPGTGNVTQSLSARSDTLTVI